MNIIRNPVILIFGEIEYSRKNHLFLNLSKTHCGVICRPNKGGVGSRLEREGKGLFRYLEIKNNGFLACFVIPDRSPDTPAPLQYR